MIHSDGTISVEKMNADEGAAKYERIGNATLSVSGNHIVFSIPLEFICGDEISYKAVYGINPTKDIMSVYKYGNCAPSGRFTVPIKIK